MKKPELRICECRHADNLLIVEIWDDIGDGPRLYYSKLIETAKLRDFCQKLNLRLTELLVLKSITEIKIPYPLS